MSKSEITPGITPKRLREHDNVRTLFIGKRRLLQIERDAKYPQMWRVRLPDGGLSDMTNIDRAKDAALEIAEGIEARKNPHKSPLKSLKVFSWSRPPVAPLQKSDPPPPEPIKIAPAAKLVSEEVATEIAPAATEAPPLPAVPDAPQSRRGQEPSRLPRWRNGQPQTNIPPGPLSGG